MLNIHLSCHKAHIIPIARFTQTLCNIAVHSQNIVPQGYKEEVVQTVVLDTSSQKVTWWGIWEIWRPLFQRQVNLFNSVQSIPGNVYIRNLWTA